MRKQKAELPFGYLKSRSLLETGKEVSPGFHGNDIFLYFAL